MRRASLGAMRPLDNNVRHCYNRAMKSVTIGARISPEMNAGLDRLAKLTGRAKSWLLCEAIQAYVAGEEDFIAAVQEGLEDLRAGRVVEHSEVVRHFERRSKKPSRR